MISLQRYIQINESYEIDYDNLSYKIQMYFQQGEQELRQAIDKLLDIYRKKHVLSDMDVLQNISHIDKALLHGFIDFCTDNIKRQIDPLSDGDYIVLLKKIISCIK